MTDGLKFEKVSGLSLNGPGDYNCFLGFLSPIIKVASIAPPLKAVKIFICVSYPCIYTSLTACCEEGGRYCMVDTESRRLASWFGDSTVRSFDLTEWLSALVQMAIATEPPSIRNCPVALIATA